MTEEGLFDVQACVFDAYGTLLDFNSAVAKHQNELGSQASLVSELWRRKQLEYTWLRSLMHCYEDFEKVTSDALNYALDTFGLADQALHDLLLRAHRSLEPYPEVPEMLAKLKSLGIRTAILSNGSPEMLADATASAGISESVDQVYSVEQVGIFKPAPQVYQLATHGLGLPAHAILFLSSNAWDIHGASTFGFRCLWINRSGAVMERLPNGPIKILDTLEPLPGLISKL